ncbi:HAMP domain-containing sensor histidine kinase [Actinomadura nitritigenes]|uniref:histidine kinase n=1 Tax=Actinomadura nitritigenes TaxID=134602 RepID=A0ABS3R961_9ACTN|nr:HAMP domain-containing sensor histidine kinase [Actinomadura nitritigenes]MBO2442765.1 HAMP domain-containing histidine kinase [Actinomadura nitritigenes]
MRPRLAPTSIRARFTLAITGVSLLVYAIIGVGVDTTVRNRIERDGFRDTQRAATEWIGSMRSPVPPQPITSGRVPYLQLVDANGSVVSDSRAASGLPALSSLKPPPSDRIQNRVQCANGRCLLLTASRVSPQEAARLWAGQSHIVYAAMPRPALLGTERLEALVAAGVLAASLLTGWAAWVLVGRTLRPVEAMRAQIAEITISDLSLRVPQPSGDDEIARLARTANQTLARLEDAMERQRRFGSMVSHELRRPLTGLRTQLEEVLLYPEADARRGVRDALATAERLQSIIEEMLMLARVGTGPRTVEPVGLAALAREEAARCAGGPPVEVSAPEELTVTGNRVQLAGVLANLLVNAQRHARASVHVTVRRSDGAAAVAVQDDGEGIAPGDRERVFEPFTRLSEGLRRDPAGSGLGLAISRTVAEAHNGTLRVEDSPRGARFVLRLPLAPPQA